MTADERAIRDVIMTWLRASAASDGRWLLARDANMLAVDH